MFMSQNINTVDISNDANLEDYVLVSVNGSLRRVKVADLKELVDSTEDIVVVDTELSTTSVNPVQNRVITAELNKKANSSDMPTYQTKIDNTLTTTSKEVVGAINENAASISQLSEDKADKSEVSELKEDLIQLNFNSDNLLNTNGISFPIVTSKQYIICEIPVSLEPNTTYTISFNGHIQHDTDGNPDLRLYVANSDWSFAPVAVNSSVNDEITSLIFTTNTDTEFKVVVYNHDTVPIGNEITLNWVQIQKGSIVKVYDYVPYGLKDLSNELEEIKSSNVLYKKKWYALGDSFTHGDYSNCDAIPNWETNPLVFDEKTGLYKTYPWFISQRNKMELTNLATNGRTITDIVNFKDYEIPEDCDYLTIMIGLNDFSISTPIGQVNADYSYQMGEQSLGTWCSSWFKIFYWLHINRPHTKVGILIISAYLSNEYRDSCIGMCELFGYAYLDMYRDPKVPMFMGKEGAEPYLVNNVYASNKVCEANSHPSVKCQEFMSTFIENFMRGL